MGASRCSHAVGYIKEGSGVSIVYYVCEDCNLYHSGRKRPVHCDRCGSTELEKVDIKDQDFNFVMQIVQKMREKRRKEEESESRA